MKYAMRTILFVIFVFLLSPAGAYAKKSNDPFAEQWAYEDIGIYDAWNYGTGSTDVIVAVIDNGFDTFHPDLRGNVWKNEDEIPNNNFDDDHNGYVDDVYGWNFVDDNNNPRSVVEHLTDYERTEGIFNHGTIIAGIIGARGNNGLDGVGVNWRVRLMNLKVIDNSGSGSFEPLDDAIYYAVDNGAQVINISMVGSGEDEALSKAVKYAYDHDVMIFAAAGNNMYDLNISPMIPVCLDSGTPYEMIFGVTAIDEEHHLARFSNSGSHCIDITAPGVDIHSLVRFSPTDGLPDRYSTSSWNGTSFSTPFVTGAAALVKSIQPDWKPKDIYNAILSTAHHTPGQDEESYANLFGAGLLRVDQLMSYAFQMKSTSSTPEDFSYGSKHMLLISSELGEYQERGDDAYISDILARDIFKGVYEVQRFLDVDGRTYYITLKEQKTDNTVRVRMYQANWIEISDWSIPGEGSYSVAVGNDGQGDFNVFVSRQDASSYTYIYMYDSEGNVLQTKKGNLAHTHGSLTSLSNGFLAYAYSQGEQQGVELLDSDLKTVNQFVVDFGVGSIGAGDVNGDGVDEIMLTSQKGTTSYVYVMKQDGSLYTKFRAYPHTYRGGIKIVVSDYNNDGVKDIVVSSVDGSQPVRVLSGTGAFIGSWWPFGERDRKDILLVPYR